MKDHKKLMRIYNKQKLLNRINDSRKRSNFGVLKREEKFDLFILNLAMCLLTILSGIWMRIRNITSKLRLL